MELCLQETLEVGGGLFKYDSLGSIQIRLMGYLVLISRKNIKSSSGNFSL